MANISSGAMDTRERILQAAARVYAQHGFRGATTRLIAIEAGVNEVSLFRTFGSKAALFEAMLQTHAASLPVPELPERPVNPQAELTPWCAALLAHMRQWRSIIRKSFGDLWGQGQSLHYYGVVLYSGSRFTECVEKGREAVRLLERTGDFWE